MRGAPTIRRLLVGPPLIRPLRGHLLRKGEGWRRRSRPLKSESPRKAQAFDQSSARFGQAFALVVEQLALQEMAGEGESVGYVTRL